MTTSAGRPQCLVRAAAGALRITALLGAVAGQQLAPLGVAQQEPAEPLYPEGLLELPAGGEDDFQLHEFVNERMEPRHAVAVGVVGKGTKRHKLLEELASIKELYPLLAICVQFARGNSSLEVHTYGYPPVIYAGKWTRSAISSWLLDVSYPLVNRLHDKFAPPKYLFETAYGAVLIVKPLTEQTDALVQALEPYAEKYRHKFRFTFFTKAEDEDTKLLCRMYGIHTNDELLLLERPWEYRTRKHSHVPDNPKYRLENMSSQRIQLFFDAYDAGTWPRYFRSASMRTAPVVQDGIRELTGWDFAEATADPSASVLVAFVSADCAACRTFASDYREVASRLQDARRKSERAFVGLTLARIDLTANEHSEHVRGTPLLRYFPRGERKRTVDLDSHTPDGIWEFLEERASEEEAASLVGTPEEGTCSSGRGRSCNA